MSPEGVQRDLKCSKLEDDSGPPQKEVLWKHTDHYSVQNKKVGPAMKLV